MDSPAPPSKNQTSEPSDQKPSSVEERSESPDQKHHNRLLDKYISVWLWSVLFGASTGLVLSLITYRTDARWGLLNAILLFVLLISVLAAVVSWRALLRYMSTYLIPKFLLHSFGAKKEKDIEEIAAKELRRAFEYLVIAASFRVVLTLLEMAYASFANFGF
jgi:ABC-type sugar transport system permease subunit